MAIVAAYLGALAVYRNRAPVAITLALFAITPGYSIMSHWAKCEQRNHWFGYWFGHDMFTPPFSVYPQMDRNTILFGGTDPGRFCPTYMIFCEIITPASCKPMDPQFDRRDVYLITQNALADNTYLDYLRAQYNRSQQIDPPFFSTLIEYVAGLAHCDDNSTVHWLSDAAFHLLDVPFTARGAAIEKRWRSEGVYPPHEIYIPSEDDSEKSFRDYTMDAQQRQAEGRLQPGEQVSEDAEGHVAVSGQVAVMEINGLLCKVIFDHNPTNSFYVEESFPLEWMYPYETPFGIIMKINRDPIPTFPDDVYTNDHAFWSKYSDRLIGNWINYDTSVKQITDWVQKVYLQNDYNGFKGDPKFLRDEDAQKAFSKLRSSQAGMYAWRLHLLLPSPPYPPVDPQYMPYRPKSDAEVQKLYRECDFAFKQSFAFCPYSPEAVVRYANFLFQFQRFDDALLVAQTCHKLDPYNGQITDLINQINDIEKRQQGSGQQSNGMDQVQSMEAEARTNPADLNNDVQLGGLLEQSQPAMVTALYKQVEPFADKALADSNTPARDLSSIAQIYAQLNDLPKVQAVLKRMVALSPDQPEIHYDLAAVTATLGQNSDALAELKIAMDLNAARLKSNPSAPNLLPQARSDPHFAPISNLPEFKQIVPPS
jgi:hypothetical protein